MLDDFIEDILKEELDDVRISDKEIEFEWRKFKKLQKEKNKEKSSESKKFIFALAALLLISFSTIDLHKYISQKAFIQKYTNKESNLI